jgi:hypothetical protein
MCGGRYTLQIKCDGHHQCLYSNSLFLILQLNFTGMYSLGLRWQYHCLPCHQPDGLTCMRCSFWERQCKQDRGGFLVNKLLHTKSSSGMQTQNPFTFHWMIFKVCAGWYVSTCAYCTICDWSFVWICSVLWRAHVEVLMGWFQVGWGAHPFQSAESINNSKGLCGKTVSEIGVSVFGWIC